MTSRTILLALSMAFLVGCQPTEHTVQTAIAQTQNAMPIATITKFLPTDTPLPTYTPSPTATATILPTSTPDLRLIDIDPRKLMIQKEDLPLDGKYFLPPEWSSPRTNAEVVSGWTVEDGQVYLSETGRILGWWSEYYRGTNSVLMPRNVYDNAVLYSTAEGAQTTVRKFGDRYVTNDGYKEIDGPHIGDLSRYFEKRETDAGGVTKVSLIMEFVHRNVLHSMIFYGLDKEVSVDFAVELANKLLYRASQVPLSDKVTFEP